MSRNKFKAIFITACCCFAAVFSEIQCMDRKPDDLEVGKNNHNFNVGQNQIDPLVMNDDQELIDRITIKIAKYERKVEDLRRLLERFQVNEINNPPTPLGFIIPPDQMTPPRGVPQILPDQVIIPVGEVEPNIPPDQMTPPRGVPQNQITESEIRNAITRMHQEGHTYAQIGVLLGYPEDKLRNTPNGSSTGKAAICKFLNGSPSPQLCNRYREFVRGRGRVIPFPNLDDH